MTWRATGVKAVELNEGSLHGTMVEGRPLVLIRLAGEIRALDGVCPHIGGDLADGTVDLGKVTCPLHGATFDIVTGAVRADPFGVVPPEGGVGPVPVYPTRLVGEAVEVDLPEDRPTE